MGLRLWFALGGCQIRRLHMFAGKVEREKIETCEKSEDRKAGSGARKTAVLDVSTARPSAHIMRSTGHLERSVGWQAAWH